MPAGINVAAGFKAGWILSRGAGEIGDIPVDQGFRSIFTTIAPTRFGETAVGQALTRPFQSVGAVLDKFLPLQVAYDEALYGAGEAACTAQALGW